MGRTTKTLLIPAKLCAVLVAGAGLAACSSSSAPDGGLDASEASAEAAAEASCSTKAPAGKVCVTDCLALETASAPIPFACDIFCDLPGKDASAAAPCFEPDGAADPDCNRSILADGSPEVLC
jgi:hypothetical protein